DHESRRSLSLLKELRPPWHRQYREETHRCHQFHVLAQEHPPHAGKKIQLSPGRLERMPLLLFSHLTSFLLLAHTQKLLPPLFPLWLLWRSASLRNDPHEWPFAHSAMRGSPGEPIARRLGGDR